MNEDLKPLAIVVSCAILAISFWLGASMLSRAAVDRAAMENGYHQVVVDGELVWRRRPVEALGKVVKWLVEIAAEILH